MKTLASSRTRVHERAECLSHKNVCEALNDIVRVLVPRLFEQGVENSQLQIGETLRSIHAWVGIPARVRLRGSVVGCGLLPGKFSSFFKDRHGQGRQEVA